MAAEQSNSSIVFGDRIALKLFRRLEPGINPELEMLRFLTARDYPTSPPLYGWYEYEGEPLAATLAIAQQFIPGAADGWDLALQEIPGAPELFLERISGLGIATARLHSVLATDAGDPAFSPQDPSDRVPHLLKATLDEQLERIFGHLPDLPSVAPIAGLEQEVRERITLPSQGPIGGKRIRIHGDYHLGQTLYTQNGWTLLDFEGEPARPLNARRQKRSPLRDVASMLRSFSYATWAVKLQRGLEAPDGFEERARAASSTPTSPMWNPRCCRPARPRSRACFRPSSSRRRCTSSSTSSTTAPTGCRSRLPGSCDWWSRDENRRARVGGERWPDSANATRPRALAHRDLANPHSVLGAHPKQAEWSSARCAPAPPPWRQCSTPPTPTRTPASS